MATEYFEFPPQWTQHEGVLYQRYKDPKPAAQLAMFDMDSTLMMTPSTLVNELVTGLKPNVGKPAVPNDFILYNPNVRQKLQEELDNGKAIVVCSNQSQLFDDPTMSKLIFARIQLLLQELDIPLYIILAFRRNLCRKPAPGMLTFYEEHLNGGIKVDRDNTFYVGDAAGRFWSNELLKANCERVLALLQAADYSDKKYMRKKKNGQLEESDAATIIAKLKPSDLRNKFQRDFSDCDHKFALNNGIKFYTPEDYFCRLPHMKLTIDFEPKKVGLEPIALDITDGMIILVGPPASGKTFLCKHVFKAFTRVNQDELKTKDKCLRVAKELLQQGKNVVIDNTNSTVAARQNYLALSKEFGVKCTLVFLDVSKDFSLHFNRFRKVTQTTFSISESQLVEQPGHQAVPQVAIHTYYSKLQPPKESEGYERFIRITDRTFPVQHTPISQMYLP